MSKAIDKIINGTLGIEPQELNRRAHEGGDLFARAICVLAMACDSQEHRVNQELGEHERTLAEIAKDRANGDQFTARSLTARNPGAGLAPELGRLEGMLYSLNLMVTSYKEVMEAAN